MSYSYDCDKYPDFDETIKVYNITFKIYGKDNLGETHYITEFQDELVLAIDVEDVITQLRESYISREYPTNYGCDCNCDDCKEDAEEAEVASILGGEEPKLVCCDIKVVSVDYVGVLSSISDKVRAKILARDIDDSVDKTAQDD